MYLRPYMKVWINMYCYFCGNKWENVLFCGNNYKTHK